MPSQRTVYDTRDPGKTLGVVITEGNEVSEVKWEDGTKAYAINTYLRTVRKQQQTSP